MDQTFKFFTDTATLAVFDPHRLENHVNDESDWWCSNFIELDELQSGALTLVSLGGDGVYTTRITDGDLTSDERDYATETVQNLGTEVVSGHLFVGPGECMPGGGSRLSATAAERGTMIELDNGLYQVDVYCINWFDSPRWWTPGDEPLDGAPADFVVLVRNRTSPFGGLDSPPNFDGWCDDFLFESSTRLIGPQPGMVLTTKVRKGANGKLVLKDCGPCDYRALLIDYSRVSWKDTIKFKVLAVDHDTQTITGDFVDVVEGT